jgi:hypothetical protein
VRRASAFKRTQTEAARAGGASGAAAADATGVSPGTTAVFLTDAGECACCWPCVRAAAGAAAAAMAHARCV